MPPEEQTTKQPTTQTDSQEILIDGADFTRSDGKSASGLELKKAGLFKRFGVHIYKHRSTLMFTTALLLALGTGGGVLFWLHQEPKPNLMSANVLPPPPPPPKPKSPLTGLEVADEATTKRPVTAIMIENSPDARPQSGLKDAGIVYEAIAEGGITRFLTLHQEDRPNLIGPVRSLRPYYIDWLAPYDPSVAHIGGSYNALKEIRSNGYKDIDQFFNASTYWRATDRYAPHNVYTSFEKLDALNSKKGFTSSSFTSHVRKADDPSKTPTASTINITMSSASYNSSYTYDKANNVYVRSQGGKPHTDREAGQITPKVAIVIKVQMTLELEDGYREQIKTTGSGKAYIFQDGNVIEGTWNKESKKAQIIFKDSSGKEVSLNAGQTWITAIPSEKTVTWQ